MQFMKYLCLRLRELQLIKRHSGLFRRSSSGCRTFVKISAKMSIMFSRGNGPYCCLNSTRKFHLGNRDVKRSEQNWNSHQRSQMLQFHNALSSISELKIGNSERKLTFTTENQYEEICSEIIRFAVPDVSNRIRVKKSDFSSLGGFTISLMAQSFT
ncbi:hypothetical protein Enr10x_39630 [Gimesia panareensis]|uniref:Uncharacterized protein n=1 Tax=Gimesia panareensis TaxID=2527978 RepID=A0A517QAG4_9PLAN|nr:hypothetical protein Enr10x_39630 [Gimesia panareensis]QDU51474.1 hypothetical protein Pan110_38400 [Gimesia panareensis]